MSRLLSTLAALLALALPALAIQPGSREVPVRRPDVGPGEIREPAPDRVRMREEARTRFREERERRRKAFLEAAKEMAAPTAGTVPGWREEAVRPGAADAAEEGADGGSALGIGGPLLIFAGAAGALVLLLGAASRLRERSRRLRRENPPPPKRMPKGAMTVKLRPRESRWAEASRRG